MARSITDLREARAGLDLLLSTATPETPPEIRARVLYLANLIRPAFDVNEWEALASTIRERFGFDVDEATAATATSTIAESIAEIVEDGWFADYLDYTKESEAPAQFHLGAMLACVSAALTRRPLIGWDAAPLYPNIYALLVGPTGTRKSTALSKARELIVEAFPRVNGAPSRVNVLPNEGSPQGYASALRRRNFETAAVSDGLILASELTVLVGKDQYKLALGEWLTDWYDNMAPVWSRALKGEDAYELNAPYVCFAGASNMTWLREIPDNLIKAGYLPRHLVFNATEKRHIEPDPQFDAARRAMLAAQLASRVVDLPERMPLSDGARTAMKAWYTGRIARQEEREADELFAAWLSRKLPHALKVATVWQIADGGGTKMLDERWFTRAARLVDWMDHGVDVVYHALGSSGEGAVSEAVLQYIERKGGSATLSSVARALKNKYNSRSVQDGVRTLILAQLVKQESEATLGTVLRLMKAR